MAILNPGEDKGSQRERHTEERNPAETHGRDLLVKSFQARRGQGGILAGLNSCACKLAPTG